MNKLIQKIIAFSLKNSVIVFFSVGILIVAGIVSLIHTPIEAFPDVTNTRARIITQWPGRGAEEIEKFVTIPITREMNTIPKKAEVRSISLFGLSVVTVLFNDDVDDFYAQQYTSNRLQKIDLPEGTEVEIEPPYGATGEVFRYIVQSDRPIKEISAIQEWTIEREILAVPGIADVVSFGGEEKIYEIQIDPQKLSSYDLSPLDVREAVEHSNVNVGGNIIDRGSQAYVVRGIGLLDKVEDIENIIIKIRGDTPILIAHVADVRISAKPRLGQVGFQDQDDVVQGIVVMLRGENPAEVIKSLKVKIKELNDIILPDDVKIIPFIDRTELVNITVKTVGNNLLEGILFVSLIVFIFLFNWRTTVIVASVIPLSFLFALFMLRMQGLPANLISMGAIDFGLLLEGTLVIVEAVFVGMAAKAEKLGMDRFNKMSKSGMIKKNAASVASYIVFAQIILIFALVPIFSFQKVEGKMFSPLAFTLGYALLGSLILSITYVPAMIKLMLKKNIREKQNFIARGSHKYMNKLFLWSSRHRKKTLSGYVGLTLICITSFLFYGSEFIPDLNEGAIYVRASLPNSISLDKSVQFAKKAKAKIRSFDEVEFVLTQTGRPNDGSDPTGFFNNEFHIQLYPKDDWKRKVSDEELLQEIRDTLNTFPGVTFAYSQPIQDNVEEYVAGVKSSLVIKIYGDDLYKLEEYADRVSKNIAKVEGVTDINVFKNIGLPEMTIQLHDHKLARYGVDIQHTQAVIEMAIGGTAATKFHEEERVFDVSIRFKKEFRDNADKIGNILIPSASGNKIPLRELATIEYATGPAFIYRENGRRYIAVGFSIEGRDLGSTIKEAQKIVKENVKLPKQNKISWAGEFESKERATKQLALIVPAVLVLILFLLYFNFNSLKDTLIAASTIPFAFIGGFVSLWITGTIFGISAGIGFIILFGVNTINSLILIAVMKENLQFMPLKEAITKGVYSRIRPIVMIALMGSVGLLPAALSTDMGSEVQKPLAITIVGGMQICMILSLTVLPQLFYWAYRKSDKTEKEIAEEIDK